MAWFRKDQWLMETVQTRTHLYIIKGFGVIKTINNNFIYALSEN